MSITLYKDQWNWEYFSRNTNSWNMEIIEKYKNQLHWGYLSSNESLPWSEILIEKFKDKWLWNSKKAKQTRFGEERGYEGLSLNFKVYELLFKNLDESQILRLLNKDYNYFDNFISYDLVDGIAFFDDLYLERQEIQYYISDLENDNKKNNNNNFYNEDLDIDQQDPNFYV